MRWVLGVEMNRGENIVNSFLLQSFGARALLLEGTVFPRFFSYFSVLLKCLLLREAFQSQPV